MGAYLKSNSNSFEKALAILDIFSEDRLECSPEEMMAILGYSRATLYRYLRTLKNAGFLTSSSDSGYMLGPRVVELDYLLRKSDPLVLYGTDHLKRLTQRYACTAFLVRWYDEKILCVDAISSTPRPLSSYPRGRPMPLAYGAIGRSIMANLPRRQLLPLIEKLLPDLKAVGLGESVNEIYDALRRIRRAGHAVAYGEVTPGAIGIASAILDSRKNPVASLCVTSAGHQAGAEDVARISADVQEATEHIRTALVERYIGR